MGPVSLAPLLGSATVSPEKTISTCTMRPAICFEALQANSVYTGDRKISGTLSLSNNNKWAITHSCFSVIL